MGRSRDAVGASGNALQSASLEMDSLRAELLSSLTSVITDTVDMVCEQHEENFTQAIHQLHRGSSNNGFTRPKPSHHASMNGDDDENGNTDYDLFHRCCQRLVAYIDANMATSPDFKQQMDRVILACHSNASETVLASVVTKKLWLHTKNAQDTDDDDAPEDEADDDDEDFVEMDVKSSRNRAPPTRAPHKAAPPAPRTAKRRAPPPPPPPSRSSKVKSPMKKRARKESGMRKPPSDEESDDDEVEESPRKLKRRASRLRYTDDENDGEQNDHDDVVIVNSEAAKQPHYGQADELLKFKDAIGDMCYADRRTPAQTRFFKDRLRKAIQFVDAQLCKPPKGKSCGWECAKIRRQMCNRDLPCRNKICRLWHDVEAHTDRCQNTYCEFRIRVMLRETMYKIDHKKMELQGYRNELHAKKKDVLDLKSENISDRENFVERRLLENEIDQLESEIENAEKDLGIFKATKKTYWATLNEIGLTVEDDANDQFPDFHGHYVEKKAAAKKKASTKASTSIDYTTTPSPAVSARSERTRRRQSADMMSSVPSPVQKRDRIMRRSTQQSLKVLTNGVIELDDDEEEDDANEEEETKTDRSANDGNARISRDDTEVGETNAEDVTASQQQREDYEEDTSKRQSGDDGDDDAAGETDVQEPSSTSVDEAQSADYVIESENPANTNASEESALQALKEVVDNSSSLPDAQASDKENDTETTGDDSAPLLPF